MKRNGQQELKRLTDGEESNAFTSLAWTRPTASAKKSHDQFGRVFSPTAMYDLSPYPTTDVNEKMPETNVTEKMARCHLELVLVQSLNTYVVSTCHEILRFSSNQPPISSIFLT
jgi:hypothetical protein